MIEKPEFSRLISVDGIILDKTREENIEASPQECAALAERLGLRELSFLKANLTIRRVFGGKTVRVAGEYAAEMVQSCVVTLRDVPSSLSNTFETFFSEDAPADDAEIDFSDADDESTAEQIVGGMIDLGEIVAQYLSLDIDPYPRAPGVSLAAQMSENGVEVKGNPFQALAGLSPDKDVKK